ncbi:hypothetical protein K503DRAFT_383870 [Rhizopogon vinicolor AM-OR11-026]|uniref:Uncharacterized protein n=1 Tax=Rhizopogon vinicolor AM-OR11-026 TaxID=1314800 RepID=A0A1B7NHQ2_9AGAM|nr:hypothetical protein K503DRAFT_383870 [Rhizopogon vinicolor AM-OR11-026]
MIGSEVGSAGRDTTLHVKSTLGHVDSIRSEGITTVCVRGTTLARPLLAMACPDSVTTKNLTGKLRLNKSLSDSVDQTLKLQGISYLMRTAISILSLTLELNHYTDDAGVERIDIKQILSGGLKAPDDNLVINNEDSRRDDHIFGPLVINPRRTKVDKLEIDFLKEGWTEDTHEDGVIYCVVRSDTEKTGKDWAVHVVWGFTIKDGVRVFARRYRFTTKNSPEPIYVKLYYDYSE